MKLESLWSSFSCLVMTEQPSIDEKNLPNIIEWKYLFGLLMQSDKAPSALQLGFILIFDGCRWVRAYLNFQ